MGQSEYIESAGKKRNTGRKGFDANTKVIL